jgi:hypothetical protein
MPNFESPDGRHFTTETGPLIYRIAASIELNIDAACGMGMQCGAGSPNATDSPLKRCKRTRSQLPIPK